MKKQKLFTILFALFCLSGFAQNVTTGEVMAVIQLGGQSYSVIHEDGTENYYKTSPHLSGCLVQGQAIELDLVQMEIPTPFKF